MSQDDLSGVIKLIIESENKTNNNQTSSTSSNSTNNSGNSTAKPTNTEKKSLKFYESIDKGINNTVKFLGGGGLIQVLAKHSQAANAILSGLLDIVGAIIDVFLMPFMPLFVKIMTILTPLIPILMKYFDALITPIIDLLIPILDSLGPIITDTIESLIPIITEAINLITNILRPILSVITSILGEVTVKQRTPEEKVEEKAYVAKYYEDQSKKSFWDIAKESANIFHPYISPEQQWSRDHDFPKKRLGGEIARDGIYYLHRGEYVNTSTKDNKSESPIIFNVVNNLELGSVSDVNYLVSMLEKQITGKLTNIARRSI